MIWFRKLGVTSEAGPQRMGRRAMNRHAPASTGGLREI